MDKERVRSILTGFLKPENYGYQNSFVNPIWLSRQGHYLTGINRWDKTKFDCFAGSVLAQQRLQEEGINSELCRGVDEAGIFHGRHFFNRLPDGTIVDPSPLYRLFGADHQVLETIEAKTILEGMKGNALPIGIGVYPFRFVTKGNNSYLSLLGSYHCKSPGEDKDILIKTELPPTVNVTFMTYVIENGEATSLFVLSYDLYKLRMSGSRLDIIDSKALQKEGLISVETNWQKLTKVEARTLEQKVVSREEIPQHQDIEEILQKDSEIINVFANNLLNSEN